MFPDGPILDFEKFNFLFLLLQKSNTARFKTVHTIFNKNWTCIKVSTCVCLISVPSISDERKESGKRQQIIYCKKKIEPYRQMTYDVNSY